MTSSNSAIFRVGIFVLLLCAGTSALAQTQGNAVQLIDCYPDARAAHNGALACGVGDNCTQYPEDVSVGDTLVIGVAQEDSSCAGGGGGVTNAPWSVADSLSNVVTTQTAQATGSNGYEQMSCLAVTTPGTDQITITGINTNTGCASTYMMCRFKNASCSLDGSIKNANSAAGSGNQSVSTSTTTTQHGVMLVSIGVPGNGLFAAGAMRPDAALAQYGGWAAPNNRGFEDLLMEYAPTQAIGTYSMGMQICCAGAFNQQAFMQTIALKPAATIAIAETALHTGAAGVSYSEQLHTIAGIAAPTYACTGLPANGLSLNPATGLISGATPSAGTLTLGCTTSDGTSTSATQSLTINIGASLSSVTVASSATFGAGTSGTISVPGTTCGDLVALVVNGTDAFFGTGWIHATSGVNNYWRDSMGSPVQRFLVNGGILGAPLSLYLFGPLPNSGTEFISYADNGGGIDALSPGLALDIKGAQAVLDVGAINSSTAVVLPSIAQSVTTVVPNEYALAATVYDDIGGILSFSPPFNLITSGNDGHAFSKAYADTTVVSPSTVTATTTLTGFGDSASTLLMALRPGLPYPYVCRTPRHRVEFK